MYQIPVILHRLLLSNGRLPFAHEPVTAYRQFRPKSTLAPLPDTTLLCLTLVPVSASASNLVDRGDHKSDNEHYGAGAGVDGQSYVHHEVLRI